MMESLDMPRFTPSADVMRKAACLSGVLAALVLAPAPAQADDTSFDADDPASCALPDSWAAAASFGGVDAGSYGGGVWTIPETFIADGEAIAVTGGEIAILLRGEGGCNTSHTITLTSSNGGLRADTEAPAGFADRLAMRYDAYWSTAVGFGDATGVRGAGITNFSPVNPGDSTTQNYLTTEHTAPGLAYFDLRLAVDRTSLGGPLIAGDYSDTITVTLNPLP